MSSVLEHAVFSYFFHLDIMFSWLRIAPPPAHGYPSLILRYACRSQAIQSLQKVRYNLRQVFSSETQDFVTKPLYCGLFSAHEVSKLNILGLSELLVGYTSKPSSCQKPKRQLKLLQASKNDLGLPCNRAWWFSFYCKSTCDDVYSSTERSLQSGLSVITRVCKRLLIGQCPVATPTTLRCLVPFSASSSQAWVYYRELTIGRHRSDAGLCLGRECRTGILVWVWRRRVMYSTQARFDVLCGCRRCSKSRGEPVGVKWRRRTVAPEEEPPRSVGAGAGPALNGRPRRSRRRRTDSHVI